MFTSVRQCATEASLSSDSNSWLSAIRKANNAAVCLMPCCDISALTAEGWKKLLCSDEIDFGTIFSLFFAPIGADALHGVIIYFR
jgi:hypothetical protein